VTPLKLRAELRKNQLRYLSGALIAVGVASRLPFQSSILHHWDSVNFALALENYDVRLHQPHPPGTFFLYVLCGRLFNLYFDDGNLSLVWVSTVATGLAAAAIFLLAAAWFDIRRAITVSLVMLTSPLIWFQGEVALSYMPEFFWTLLIVYTCLKVREPGKRSLFASALLMGLAGGIRPNTPVFLFPLWLFVLIQGLRARRYTSKEMLIALLVLALGVSIWAVPTVVMSGGLAAYLDAFSWWRGQHVESSGTLQGITLHLARLAVFLCYALGAALLPVAWVLLKDWRVLKENLPRDWRARAVCIWVLPGLAYYIFIHVQQSGHIFTILPAVIILGGLSVARLGHFLSMYNRSALPVVTSIVIASNMLFFALGPANMFGASRVTLASPTWKAIHQYDSYVSNRLDAIRTHFSPEDTVVLADPRNFRIPDYYLREYQNTSLSYQIVEESVALPRHVRTLVFFDDSVADKFSSDLILQTLHLPQEDRLRYVSWSHNQWASLSRSSIEIHDK
jgi:hypothetical protein